MNFRDMYEFAKVGLRGSAEERLKKARRWHDPRGQFHSSEKSKENRKKVLSGIVGISNHPDLKEYDPRNEKAYSNYTPGPGLQRPKGEGDVRRGGKVRWHQDRGIDRKQTSEFSDQHEFAVISKREAQKRFDPLEKKAFDRRTSKSSRRGGMARLVQDHRINVGAVTRSKEQRSWPDTRLPRLKRYTSQHGSQESTRGAPSRQLRGNDYSEFSDQHEFANRRARESRRMGAVIREGARRGGVNEADRDSAHRYNEDLSNAQYDAGEKLRIAEMPSSRLVRKSMEKKGMLPNIQRGQTSEFGEPMNFSDFYEFVRYPLPEGKVPFRSETKYRQRGELTRGGKIGTPRASRGPFGHGPPKKGLSEKQIAKNQAEHKSKQDAGDTSIGLQKNPRSAADSAAWKNKQGSFYIDPKTGGFREKGYKPTQKQPNRIPSDRRGQPIGGRAHDVRESEGRQSAGKIMGIHSEFGDQHEFISRSLNRRLSPKHKKWYHTVSRRLRGVEVGERQEKQNAPNRHWTEKTSPAKDKLTRRQVDTSLNQDIEKKAGKKRWKGRQAGVRVDTSGRGPATQYGINAGRDKRINQSEFGDMRNFSDEQFLLFFANQYPEAFHQIAGEFSEFGDQHEFVSRKERNVQRAKSLHGEGMSRRVIRGGYPSGSERRAGKFKIARAHGDAGEEARQYTPSKHSSSEPSARLIRQQMETAGLLPNVGGVKTYPYKEARPGTMTRRARRETEYGGSHSEFSDPISRQPKPREVDKLAQKEGYGIAGRHDLNRRGGVARRTQDMDINEGWRDPGSHGGPPAGRRYRSAHGGPRRIQIRGTGKKGRRGGQASEFSDLHEFDCKRRLAKGRQMLKFMEGYYA